MKAAVVVLNYNQKELLKECLPSIVKAANKSENECRVCVLDNCSTDSSVEFLANNFPRVEIFRAKENKVYCSYNEIARQMKDDIIIIMNNDIKVDEDYIDWLINHFQKRDDILFVAARGYSFDGQIDQADRAIAGLRWGIIEPMINYSGYKDLIGKAGNTFSAGVGAFDRKKFLELEGYDEIYLPGRYEDVDLCFRGWKKGYVGIYEPRAIHYHKGGESFKKEYKEKQVAQTVFRNSILFTLKNVTDPLMLARALILTVFRTFVYILSGRWHIARGFFMAVSKSGEALESRKRARYNFRLTDRQVIKTVNSGVLEPN